ncbi:MAG: hypothetical protein RXQ62_03290 [Nitrososphaeria archaeon]
MSPWASTTTAEPLLAALSTVPGSPSRSVTRTSGTTPLSRRAAAASSAAIRECGNGGHPRAMRSAHGSSDGPAPTMTAVLQHTRALSSSSLMVLGRAAIPRARAAARSARGFSRRILAMAAYAGSHLETGTTRGIGGPPRNRLRSI